MSKKKELVVVDPSEYAVVKSKVYITEVVAANLGGDTISALDLEKIEMQITSSGKCKFYYETVDGDENPEEICGVIVHAAPTRVRWEESYDESGGGSPPVCVSMNLIDGHGDPGG